MPVKIVSEQEIRDAFNNGPFLQMIRDNRIVPRRTYSYHLPSPEDWQGPFCTHSQIIAYVDSRKNLIAEIHRYLRPDGTLGASGRPDPKRLLVEGVLWAVSGCSR